MKDGFPTDHYTPFGYLDNPGHAWKLHRTGLVRVLFPARVVWNYPNVSNCSTALSLHFGLAVGGGTLLASRSYASTGSELSCPYHSKNLIIHRLLLGAVELVVQFAMGADDLLLGVCQLRNCGAAPQPARLLALTSFASLEDRSGLWQFGAAARYWQDKRALIMRSFAEGPAFAVQPTIEPEAVNMLAPGSALTEEALLSWDQIMPGRVEPGRSWRGALLEIPLVLSPGGKRVLEFRVACGWSERDLMNVLRRKIPPARQVIAAREDEDARFWTCCPRLEGDWPAHWRRGWVYDWETLRMCVRPPTGIFRGHWDGMQVQKPRLVLAEAALDMLMFSYADPQLAKEVLLTTFADAHAPQVPCVREDGSTNMVATDGSECGTSPAWCFPLYCIESIFLRDGDRRYLRKVLPHLERYVHWWLKHRRDHEGWAYYKCSWESGQDCSQKFLTEQPTGGELVEHLRPVDLQVGLYLSIESLVRMRQALGLPAAQWHRRLRQWAEMIATTWQEQWFCDFDRRSQTWVQPHQEYDITNLSPLLGALASDEQVRFLMPKIRWFLDNPRYWLEWPSFFFMFAEILWQIEQREMLAGLVYDTADRVYRQWDRRTWEPGFPMPGVSLECWGLDGPKGTEGYGWGATLPLHILRGIVGYRECRDKPEAMVLCPALPKALVPDSGRQLAVKNLFFRGRRFNIAYEHTRNGQLATSLEFQDEQQPVLAIRSWDGSKVPFAVRRSKGRSTVTCTLRNMCAYTVNFTRE